MKQLSKNTQDWLSTITSSILFLGVATSIYAIISTWNSTTTTYGLGGGGVLSRIVLLGLPINGNIFHLKIVLAPFALTLLVWCSFFLFIYYKSFTYYTLQLFAFIYGIDEVFYDICYYTVYKGNAYFNMIELKFSVFGIQYGFSIIGIILLIVCGYMLRDKITWKYGSISKMLAFWGFLLFAEIYTYSGVPIVENGDTWITTNWIWELVYQIVFLSLIFLTVKKKDVNINEPIIN